jgi:hypothetical protein
MASTDDGAISSRCWATRRHHRARRGQQPAVLVLDISTPTCLKEGANIVGAFRRGLSETVATSKATK